MKYSIVTPIHKKGDTKNYTNYRPISLLTSFSKVSEKIILRRLLTHVHACDILADEQFGFHAKFSTETASYNLINKVMTAINNKKKEVVFFLTWRRLLTVLITKYFYINLDSMV
jgi:hypothetical protein